MQKLPPELAPTPECGAPRGPSVPRGTSRLLSGDMGRRGCCLLCGNPGAALSEPGRCGGAATRPRRRARRAQRLRLPARAAARRSLRGAQPRRAPLGGDRRRESVRACVCAPARPRLSGGDSAAPPAAPGCLLSAVLGERRFLPGSLQRGPATLWLHRSVAQASLGSQEPPAAVGRVLPAPSPPRPSSPGPPPLLLALQYAPDCASALRSLSPSWPRASSPLLLGVGLPGWKRKTESVVSKFGPWTTPVPGYRWAQLQPVPPSPKCSLARPPARSRSPALSPAQPRIAVAC